MKTFIVLGMHRSATSLVAKGLHECQVQIGDILLGANETNKYGHWEDTDFIRINDKLLSLAGGSWDEPPPEQMILNLAERCGGLIKAVIEKKQQEPFWGWKDPRTTLTIKLFLPYLENPHFFCCFRDPVEVAKSLERRNEFSIEKSIRIARIYNNRMIKFITEWNESRYNIAGAI